MMTGDGRRLPMNPALAGLLAGILLAAVIGLMATINLSFGAPWSKTHTVSAQVSDADGIAAGSDVRIAGRFIGQVTAVDSHGQFTSVKFHVNDDEWPLPQDTTASIRLANLVGQKYLQLEPGKSHSALADDAVIGLTATKPVVDFDQMLDTFDKPTRDSLTSVIRTLGASFQNQEGTLQQALPTLGSVSVNSVKSTAVLANRNSEVNNILINLGTTLDTLNKSRDDLAGVFDNLNSITGALAQHQGALEGYIANTTRLNQTTDAVLGNGGAQQFNAGLQKVGTFVTLTDVLFRDLIPQTQSYISTGASKSGLDLIYTISDATSQSNKSGYFLRQVVDGADLCGLPLACGPSPSSAPPVIQAPALPALPQIPSVLPPQLCAALGPVPGCPANTPPPPLPPVAIPPLPGAPPLPTPPPIGLPPVPTLPALPGTAAYSPGSTLMETW